MITLIPCIAIAAIAGLEATAMLLGINGDTLAASLALIAGLGGYIAISRSNGQKPNS